MSRTILKCLYAVFIAIKASSSETDTPEVKFILFMLNVILPGFSANNASQIDLCFIELETILFLSRDFLVSSKYSGSTE